MNQTTDSVGVIIARFQVKQLHEGHRHLIGHVMAQHQSVVVLLGYRDIQLNDVHSLDVPTRTLMINEAYPNITVLPLLDTGDDATWSKKVDEVLATAGVAEPILYGSRQSFIPHYVGKHRCVEVEPVAASSGTELRKTVAQTPLASEDFRAGVIYAAQHRFGQGHPTVDVALIRAIKGPVIEDETRQVLLGRRSKDDTYWRFPGGFFDSSLDDSLEAAAKRELAEEASVNNVGTVTYVASPVIDDWRYRDSRDRIVTSFFMVEYLNGAAAAGDDLHEVRWFSLSELPQVIVPSHQPLVAALYKRLNIRVSQAA